MRIKINDNVYAIKKIDYRSADVEVRFYPVESTGVYTVSATREGYNYIVKQMLENGWIDLDEILMEMKDYTENFWEHFKEMTNG